MTNPIDTSPARLKQAAACLDTLVDHATWISELLLAIAAEKEAQAGQEPAFWQELDEDGTPLCGEGTFCTYTADGMNPFEFSRSLYLAPQPRSPAGQRLLAKHFRLNWRT
jgi:hypothetical protein